MTAIVSAIYGTVAPNLTLRFHPEPKFGAVRIVHLQPAQRLDDTGLLLQRNRLRLGPIAVRTYNPWLKYLLMQPHKMVFM